MKTLSFKTLINAPREKVWKILWDDETYSQWTSVFDPGSKAVTDNWEQGSKILFLSGSGDGMYSTIDRKIENEYMSFKHLGEIKAGKELPIDPDNGWSGAMENYTLHEAGGITQLLVEVDINEKDAPFMERIFPQALQKLKNLAEE